MCLSWEAERDQAISMQRESERRSMERHVKEAVKQGVQEVLGGLQLTPEQTQYLRKLQRGTPPIVVEQVYQERKRKALNKRFGGML